MKLILTILLFFNINLVSAAYEELLKKQVASAEKQYQLPTGMLDAIITVESNYRTKATNPVNFKKSVFISSFGPGQLTISTARAHCSLSRTGLLNPTKNILCSAKILRNQLDRFDNSILNAVSAYNQGTPCICDGQKYLQDLNGKIKVCRNFKTKKVFTCTKKEMDRFLNQDYVENFLKAYQRLHPDFAPV